MPEEKDKSVAVRVQITKQIGDKAAMTFETWIDQTLPIEVANALVDKLMEVADKQTRKYELIDLKMYEQRVTREVDGLEDQYNLLLKKAEPKLVNGRRTPVVDKSTQATITNTAANIEERKKHLRTLRNDIKQREANL